MSTVPPTFLRHVFTRKSVACAGTSLLIYDYLLTFSLEVTHIWSEPWTLVKLLFLVNRYGNLIGQTAILLEESGRLSNGSRYFCMAFVVYIPFFAIFSGESVRIFVVMRACAISGCKPRVALFTNMIYVLYGTGALALSIFYVLSTANTMQFDYLEEIGLCYVPITGSTAKNWMFWFVPMFLDVFAFAFVWYTLYQFTRACHGARPSRLIRLLARDALFFFLAALFNDVMCIVCWAFFNKDPRVFLQILITYPVLSVIGQRLVLNLRELQVESGLTYDLSQEVNRQIALLAAGEERQGEQEPEQEPGRSRTARRLPTGRCPRVRNGTHDPMAQ